MWEKETWEMRTVKPDSKECRNSFFFCFFLHTVLWVCHSKWQPPFFFSKLDPQHNFFLCPNYCMYNTSMKQPLKTSHWNQWSCNFQHECQTSSSPWSYLNHLFANNVFCIGNNSTSAAIFYIFISSVDQTHWNESCLVTNPQIFRFRVIKIFWVLHLQPYSFG